MFFMCYVGKLEFCPCPCSEQSVRQSNLEGSLQLGLNQWKVQTSAATDGASDLRSLILKVSVILNLFAHGMFQFSLNTIAF